MRLPAADLSVEDDGDVRFWTPERAARNPLPSPPSINVLDLRGSPPDPALLHPAADLLLVDGPAGWAALAPDTPCLALPAIADPAEHPTDAPQAVHLLLGRQPSDHARHLACLASDWADSAGLVHGVLAPSGLADVARFGSATAVPGIILDLREGADLFAEPLALVQAMADGSPVLFVQPSPWREEVARAGAGRPVPPASVADLSTLQGFRELSAAALAYVRDRHSRAAALAVLRQGLAAARARCDHDLAHWPLRTAGLFVLVVSSEALNLLDVRVHLPLASLHARGAIAGYAILRHGEYVFSTEPVSPTSRFGAIWVQRSQDPLVELLLQSLGRPFVYDLDDLLLVSPSYREPFPAESTGTARSLVGQARVLSCATPRLARLAQAHGGEGAVRKAVVTPNLSSGPALALAGPPRALVWPSSDWPALAGSRGGVERAVRDFALAHGLRILCLGAPAPSLLASAGLQVEHVGLLPYGAYLERLRAEAPGILLAPLETAADPATQDFVDAKSDVKLIEARMTGLVGVFSRAAPYLDSDLGPEILCDNTYESWLDGLERARALCLRQQSPPPFPAARAADGLGPLPWAEALFRARTAFTGADVTAAIRYVRGQGESLVAAPAAFDEDDYLRRHPDVRDAVAAGVVASGYRHYVQSGLREGREARRRPTPDAADAFWWPRLLHRLGELEARTSERDHAIARLGEQSRTRAALRRDDPAPPSVPEPAGEITWSPPGTLATPCPVCHFPGPHEKVVAFMGETLGHCRICGTRFYERRESYDYEDPKAADLLLQLNLEQNAGIHHQTRPLFAVDGAASLLDVGCGFGFSVDLAASLLGWRAVGVEPSFYGEAGRAALGADIRRDYLTEVTDLGDPFDLVLASEVIEHLPAPSGFLVLLARHLSPAGTLVLSTPDAAAIDPGLGAARLLAILAPRVHLVLFTRDSLARALQQAGFEHVCVERAGDGLIAYASRLPLRFRPDADANHAEAYQRYLETLLERAPAASPLWNGAAGRLLTWLAPSAPDATLDALFARIAEAWRVYGLDLAAPTIPRPGGLQSQPFNLAPVLLARAHCTARVPGRSPAAILAYARLAYRIALDTGRALQAANMVDHDLRATAQRARMLALDALAELAPELEASLLAGLLQPSPGALAEWADPPPDAATPRLAVAFATAVAAGQHDEARRLEPALGSLDQLCRILDGSDETLLRVLFALGAHRLSADRDPHAALYVFRRMAAEARRRLHRGPAIADLLQLAEDHMTIATHRIRNSGEA